VKFEIRCPSCRKAYLVDEARIPEGGAQVTCQACGAAVLLPAPRSATVAAAGRRSAGRPERPREATPARPTDVTPPASTARKEVVCPRCGLHFVPSGAARTAGGSRRVILVVEDMGYFQQIVRDALAPRYEVRAARSVREAEKILATSRADLILLDLTLEGGEDGIRLLQGMRRKPCPILIFSAQDEAEMFGDRWQELQALGADDLVVKGMNVADQLLRKVTTLLGEPLEEGEPEP
jgi:predicted Zn finger-like uncharacterized protein